VLDLSQGEVFVNVVRKGTAFAVRTTAGEARALGTKYNVSLRQDEGGQEMNGLKSAVGAVMMVTVMAGTVEVIAQDQPAKVLGTGESVSVQAPKQRSAYGYFVGLVGTNGSFIVKWNTHRIGATDIGKADVPQALPVADQDAVAKAASQLKPGDPIEVVIAGGVIDVKKASPDAVLAAQRERQEAFQKQIEKGRQGEKSRKSGQYGQ
jgi:hypothetical protein